MLPVVYSQVTLLDYRGQLNLTAMQIGLVRLSALGNIQKVMNLGEGLIGRRELGKDESEVEWSECIIYIYETVKEQNLSTEST